MNETTHLKAVSKRKPAKKQAISSASRFKSVRKKVSSRKPKSQTAEGWRRSLMKMYGEEIC